MDFLTNKNACFINFNLNSISKRVTCSNTVIKIYAHFVITRVCFPYHTGNQTRKSKHRYLHMISILLITSINHTLFPSVLIVKNLNEKIHAILMCWWYLVVFFYFQYRSNFAFLRCLIREARLNYKMVKYYLII